MKDILNNLISEMIEYEKGNPRRVQHFLKVHAFAKIIAEQEGLDERTQDTLEIAAVLHDIGIKPSVKKYGSSAGNYQEIEGPPVARLFLKKYNVSDEIMERVSFLIANHHTYGSIQAVDYQVLIEADFLVNIYEDSMKASQIENIRDRLFKTKTGVHLLETMFLSQED
ncbi:HD family phosphohydrolase [Lacrimispora indolis]|nr:HD family phosphohydrolase [[Clostridium] methoxybenzovorans]